MSTRHISFHVGMIHVQSIYDKSLMRFSSNIQKSINIVEYQIHRYDTHNTYALRTSITTSSMDIITYYQQTMRLYQISKTNHSKHIRWSCCPSMWCSLYEKRGSVVMWSHKIQHKQPTSYVALDFKIEAPFISYFCSSCFIPYGMLI